MTFAKNLNKVDFGSKYEFKPDRNPAPGQYNADEGLKHTKENLNRLNDVMKEITSQLNKLERQAKAAKDYKELKNSERDLKVELLAIKWNNYDQDIEDIDKKISKDNISDHCLD